MATDQKHILLVEDCPHWRAIYVEFLSKYGKVAAPTSKEELDAISLSGKEFEAMFLDESLGLWSEGLEIYHYQSYFCGMQESVKCFCISSSLNAVIRMENAFGLGVSDALSKRIQLTPELFRQHLA